MEAARDPGLMAGDDIRQCLRCRVIDDRSELDPGQLLKVENSQLARRAVAGRRDGNRTRIPARHLNQVIDGVDRKIGVHDQDLLGADRGDDRLVEVRRERQVRKQQVVDRLLPAQTEEGIAS